MHDGLMPSHQSDPACSPTGSLLDIRVALTETGPMVVLSGEADMTTSTQLEDALNAQLAAATRILLVEVSGLRFADSAAIGAVAKAARALKARGGRLELLSPQPGLARTLTLLGVDQIMTVRGGTGPRPRQPCSPLSPDHRQQ